MEPVVVMAEASNPIRMRAEKERGGRIELGSGKISHRSLLPTLVVSNSGRHKLSRSSTERRRGGCMHDKRPARRTN